MALTQTADDIVSITGRLIGRRITILQVLGINSLKSLTPPVDAVVGDTVEGVDVAERAFTLRTSRHMITFDLQRTGKVLWLSSSDPFRAGSGPMPTVRLITNDGSIDLTEPAKTKRITVMVNDRSA